MAELLAKAKGAERRTSIDRQVACQQALLSFDQGTVCCRAVDVELPLA